MSDLQKGFTLVELLIVIAIIAVMAVGMFVGINPFEQIRKTKDSSSTQLAVELMRAIERKYTSSLSFTWGAADLTDAHLYGFNTVKSGIENGAGVLINTGELKKSFGSLAMESGLLAGNYNAVSGSFWTCYIPVSATAKNGYIENSITLYNSFSYMLLNSCNGNGICDSMSIPTNVQCGQNGSNWIAKPDEIDTFTGDTCALCARTL